MEENGRHGSGVTDMRMSVADDGPGPNVSGEAQKSEMIQKRVLEERAGRTVTMWREQNIANISDPNGTQISYEEFCAGGALASGGSTSHATRKQSNQDLDKRRLEGKGDGRKLKGKDDQTAGNRHLSVNRKNVSTRTSLKIFVPITVTRLINRGVSQTPHILLAQKGCIQQPSWTSLHLHLNILFLKVHLPIFLDLLAQKGLRTVKASHAPPPWSRHTLSGMATQAPAPTARNQLPQHGWICFCALSSLLSSISPRFLLELGYATKTTSEQL
jgi:hypothetical protein